MSSEIKSRTVKAFALFAAILFIGLQIGGWLSKALPISTGNTNIDMVIAWILIVIPVWIILRKWKLAQKAIAQGQI